MWDIGLTHLKSSPGEPAQACRGAMPQFSCAPITSAARQGMGTRAASTRGTAPQWAGFVRSWITGRRSASTVGPAAVQHSSSSTPNGRVPPDQVILSLWNRRHLLTPFLRRPEGYRLATQGKTPRRRIVMGNCPMLDRTDRTFGSRRQLACAVREALGKTR